MFLLPTRHLVFGLLIGVCLGLVVASAMSYHDWQLNPGGIFHSDRGTNWRFVWDTWISWFVPVWIPATIATWLVLAGLSMRKAWSGSRHR